MSTLHLTIRDDLRRQAEARAAQAGFANLEAYVESLIEADAHALDHEQIEALLLQRLDDGNRVVMDDVDFAQIRAKVQAQIAQRAHQRRS